MLKQETRDNCAGITLKLFVLFLLFYMSLNIAMCYSNSLFILRTNYLMLLNINKLQNIYVNTN